MNEHRHFDLHLGREITVYPMVERLFWVALGILGVGVLGVLGYQINLNKLPFEAMTYTFSSLVAVHAVYMLGWKRALSFFCLTLVISFVMEYLGAKTGRIFGAYYYTEALNPKILGTVPVVIPFAYFMVLYPSRMIADLMVWGKAVGVTKGMGWSLLTATLAGLVMTAWDLTMDPVMVRQVEAWVWTEPGPW
ncbi:MAG: carotenoid biosynthesis protein, partial [Holophaga sp.]|nr:carotenoid biosynthesis protein [Holophaga sp.]